MRCYCLFGLLLIVNITLASDCKVNTEMAYAAISANDANACLELYSDAEFQDCISPELKYGIITTIRHSRGEAALSAPANENNPNNLKSLCSQYIELNNVNVPAESWHQLNSTLFYFEKWQCQIHYLSDVTFAEIKM